MSSLYEFEDTPSNWPLSFDSQHELCTWLRKANPDDLLEVDSLTLSVSVSSYNTIPEELSNITTALRAFPNIKAISLPKRPADCTDETHTSLYDMLLRYISRTYTGLTYLSVHTNHHSINFVRTLSHLRTLQFTGFATSTPMESLSALSRLRHLQHIILVPSPCSHRLSHQPCLTREVLRGLRSLKHMTIRDASSTDPTIQPLFSTSFIAALAGMTHTPLARLSIELSDFTPEDSVSRTFGAFLATSHLRRLNVCWGQGGAGGDVRILNALPRTLTGIRFNRLDPVGMECLVERRRKGMLPLLKEVIVQVSAEDVQLLEDVDEAARIQAARQELDETGVEVSLVA